jgi:hypothetical protein
VTRIKRPRRAAHDAWARTTSTARSLGDVAHPIHLDKGAPQEFDVGGLAEGLGSRVEPPSSARETQGPPCSLHPGYQSTTKRDGVEHAPNLSSTVPGLPRTRLRSCPGNRRCRRPDHSVGRVRHPSEPASVAMKVAIVDRRRWEIESTSGCSPSAHPRSAFARRRHRRRRSSTGLGAP